MQATEPLINDPAGVLAALLAILAAIFWFGETGPGRRLFGVVPRLVFCYFIPTTLTTLGILPESSPLYDWIKTFLLPASLVLLILALDVPGILRLGPRAVIMLLAGTTGVVVGAPIALWLFSSLVPPDTWQGMTALSGSWIGGGANMVALAQIAGTSESMFGMMVIVDVAVANIWMGVLLYMAGQAERIDRWTGADTSAIEDLKRRVTEFQEKTTRVPQLQDLIMIVAIGFGGMWVATLAAQPLEQWAPFFSATVWKMVVVTALAVALSFSPARQLEGAGASKIGSLMLYLLVASIGAHANFNEMREAPMLIAVGAVWMLFHVAILLGIARLIRAPVFFVAVGSQANIGGAASAPIVASAFHPSLAPVGVLLAVAGYVLGTYAGLLCMWLLKAVAGA
ncbi:MAG: DUF819 family protein [Gammaproteobacteria bacterium]|nr:DUF819 family protein [Gammaproteobacteria bacterium]